MIESPFCKFASNFLADEDGAVTVDWVMLTAGIVVLGVLIVGLISSSLTDTSTEIALVIDSALS
jgi:Flp pilus assembly pilin Flp